MRKLTYFIATSFDGFVSRSDGALNDFTMDGEHVQDLLDDYPETIPTHLRSPLNVDADAKLFDTVLMGRRTYEVGSSQGFTCPYQHLKQYLFSNSMNATPDDRVHLVGEDAVGFVRQLKQENGMGIWLCGGPELASTLADEIDELIVKVNPFLMGEGKPLFARSMPRRGLQLEQHRVYPNGFALFRYAIV